MRFMILWVLRPKNVLEVGMGRFARQARERSHERTVETRLKKKAERRGERRI